MAEGGGNKKSGSVGSKLPSCLFPSANDLNTDSKQPKQTKFQAPTDLIFQIIEFTIKTTTFRAQVMEYDRLIRDFPFRITYLNKDEADEWIRLDIFSMSLIDGFGHNIEFTFVEPEEENDTKTSTTRISDGDYQEIEGHPDVTLLRLLFIHGGGYKEGRNLAKQPFARYLRRRFPNCRIERMIDTSEFELCIEQQTRAIRKFRPDVVIGKSQGGPLLLKLIQRGVWNGPSLFLCPAIVPGIDDLRLPENVPFLIVCGEKDIAVPIKSGNLFLNANKHLPKTNIKLIFVDDDHSLDSLLHTSDHLPKRLKAKKEKSSEGDLSEEQHPTNSNISREGAESKISDEVEGEQQNGISFEQNGDHSQQIKSNGSSEVDICEEPEEHNLYSLIEHVWEMRLRCKGFDHSKSLPEVKENPNTKAPEDDCVIL